MIQDNLGLLNDIGNVLFCFAILAMFVEVVGLRGNNIVSPPVTYVGTQRKFMYIKDCM